MHSTVAKIESRDIEAPCNEVSEGTIRLVMLRVQN